MTIYLIIKYLQPIYSKLRYEYTIIPSTQVQPLSISMIATNIGANTQTVGFDYSLESSGNVVDNGMSSSTVSLNLRK